MTANVQNYARRKQIPVDTVQFGHKLLREEPSELTSKPASGCYIYGLFLEGAAWDKRNMCITESAKSVLFTKFPVIWLDPVNRLDKIPANSFRHPMYKVSTRAGTLSTTGHSTNFVMFLNIPAGPLGPAHWIKRGVAFLCLLDT